MTTLRIATAGGRCQADPKAVIGFHNRRLMRHRRMASGADGCFETFSRRRRPGVRTERFAPEPSSSRAGGDL
jgi:hypothetical protein